MDCCPGKPVIHLKPKPPSKTITLSCLETCCYTLRKTNLVYTFINNLTEPKMLYVTMSAGGGAGGIGRVVRGYFISGGGGGAGSTVRLKPVQLNPQQQLHVKLGRGGIAKSGLNGETSYLRVVQGEMVVYELILAGGRNGHPLSIDIKNPQVVYEHETKGGAGGRSRLHDSLSGQSGQEGVIGIPSQLVALGGQGGNNSFEQGGNGGGNGLGMGGCGGNNPPNVDIIGQDGQFGSGGGGSCPLSNHELEKLSGHGGDGFAMIQFCCESI
jgi:hypothetical protein